MKQDRHGMTKTRLYFCWRSMLNRCYWPQHENFDHYGGRGIQVCADWQHTFRPFMEWALSNGYADTLTLDRKDSNGHYAPDNCKWSTMIEQNSNRATTRKFVFRGEVLTTAEIARRTGVDATTIRCRLNRSGWPNGGEFPEFILASGRIHRLPKYIPQKAA